MGTMFGKKLYKGGPGHYMFFCPGCGHKHSFTTEEGPFIITWRFNGDPQYPTFAPSLRVRRSNGHVCHLFLVDGNLQYLGDSSHYLAGQTVPLPDWELSEE